VTPFRDDMHTDPALVSNHELLDRAAQAARSAAWANVASDEEDELPSWDDASQDARLGWLAVAAAVIKTYEELRP